MTKRNKKRSYALKTPCKRKDGGVKNQLGERKDRYIKKDERGNRKGKLAFTSSEEVSRRDKEKGSPQPGKKRSLTGITAGLKKGVEGREGADVLRKAVKET